jgi:predicted extracellular nuclease
LSSCCHKSPAVLLGLIFAAGCSDSGLSPQSAADLCGSDTTAITAVQGDGDQSPLAGSEATVKGVVTYVAKDGGFYIEDTLTPPDPTSSRALFISDDELSLSVRQGQQLALTGRVSELGTALDKLTSLVDITGHAVCLENAGMPLTGAKLPMGPIEREAMEGMRISLEQELTVTDVYKLFGGELTLSSNGVLRVPTEIRMPGPAANQLGKENRKHSIVALLPGPGGPLAVGSTTPQASGLMGHDGRSQQFFLDSVPQTSAPPLSLVEPPAKGMVRIVNSNLLNFFNGDGKGGGFPTERGAENPDEFEAQSARTRAAMTKIQPDLLAVQELENDGFGAHSAAVSLLAVLNDTGNDDWAFIAPGPGPIGGDVITVGLFYRQQVLESIGAPRLLDSSEFRGLSRQPLAQLFRDRRNGKTVLVAVNHLKSKGRCPDNGQNSDQQDGQGCWNQARVSAVKAQLPWLEKLASEMGTENVIILGDMNAWRNEDPIRRFAQAGYVDLVEQLSGLPQHSYLYWGQTGTLDYAFASKALAGQAQRAFIWNVNADFPRKMDQSLPWLRASDHDPVIVDFDFSQSATSD